MSFFVLCSFCVLQKISNYRQVKAEKEALVITFCKSFCKVSSELDTSALRIHQLKGTLGVLNYCDHN